MILVLTKCLLEINSDLVIDWLSHYRVKHAVLTGDELLTQTQMLLCLDNKANETLSIRWGDEPALPLDDVGAVWFRRRMDESSFLFYEQLSLDTNAKHGLLAHLKVEYLRFYSILPSYLRKAYWLSHPDKSSMNKIATLMMAKHCGLSIPETMITNFIPSAQTTAADKNFISKPLAETTVISEESVRYSMLTKEVDIDRLITDTIVFPTILQQCIEKEFEIRSFYLSGRFYSMAIFSQSNERTKTDYRNYDTENENRCVPYQLPKVVEQKIRKLMRSLKLNAGSIDIIKTPADEYVFLEINPVGQFDWVSLNCNYSIEKDIAHHLINKDSYETKRKKIEAATIAETLDK